jgi:hypothetical protein
VSFLDLNNKFVEYMETRDHYYRNLEKTLVKRDYRKSSELLWGTITQSVKALAAMPPSPREIIRHGEFFSFTESVAREIGDETYYELFVELNILHRNFYDKIIPENSFRIYMKKAKKFLKKTQCLINEKSKRYGN